MNTIRTVKSPGETPGFLRDFSGSGRKVKVQGEQTSSFGSYTLDLRTGQLWRDQENVKLTPKNAETERKEPTFWRPKTCA
jgi:hypothetical protein